MSFADNAALAGDAEFVNRLGAALGVEALAKPDTDALANTILGQPSSTSAFLFMPAVSSAPGFGDKYAAGGQESISDADITSAVQAAWVRVGSATTG